MTPSLFPHFSSITQTPTPSPITDEAGSQTLSSTLHPLASSTARANLTSLQFGSSQFESGFTSATHFQGELKPMLSQLQQTQDHSHTFQVDSASFSHIGMSQPPSNHLIPALKPETLLQTVDRLKFFLATAPGSFDPAPFDTLDPLQREERLLNRFLLPTGEHISCVLWNGLYHITGTDIVRALHFRFLAFGRPVRNVKKFEEGIFSDLRNLKSGADATLEEPKSPFLELLFKYNCIRTQKKQKVFYWFSVPHDRLFLDALDRDLKREKLGVEATTEAIAEPALSFTYNPQKSLFEQFTQVYQQQTHGGNQLNEEKADKAKKRPADIDTRHSSCHSLTLDRMTSGMNSPEDCQSVYVHPPSFPSSNSSGSLSSNCLSLPSISAISSPVSAQSSSAILGTLNLFEGSPSYKQRRKSSGKKDTAPRLKKSLSLGPIRGQTVPLHHHHHHPYHQSAPSAPPYINSPHFNANTTSLLPPRLDVGSDSLKISSPPLPVSFFNMALTPSIVTSGQQHLITAHSQPVSLTLPESSVSSSTVHYPSNDLISLADSKAYVCPLYSCGKLFKKFEHLKKHVKSHTLEKPFACSQCEKSFVRSENLAIHLKNHDKFSGLDSGSSHVEDSFEGEEEDLLAMTATLDGMDSRSSDGNEDEYSLYSTGLENLHPPSSGSYYDASLQRSGSLSSYESAGSTFLEQIPSIRRHMSAAPVVESCNRAQSSHWDGMLSPAIGSSRSAFPVETLHSSSANNVSFPFPPTSST